MSRGGWNVLRPVRLLSTARPVLCLNCLCLNELYGRRTPQEKLVLKPWPLYRQSVAKPAVGNRMAGMLPGAGGSADLINRGGQEQLE